MILDPQAAKLIDAVFGLGEFKPLDEVVGWTGITGPVDYGSLQRCGVVVVQSDGRKFVGTRSLIDKKINTVKTVLDQGRTVTMDEVGAMLHPLPLSEQYLQAACGGLVEVSGGFIGRRAMEAAAQKAVGTATQFINQKGFASASAITNRLKSVHDFEVPFPDLGGRIEVLLYRDEPWYFLPETTKPLPFSFGATRAEAGLPLRSPIKSGSAFVYLGSRTALVSEAAHMLKISVTKVKKLITDHTLDAFTYGKTTRVSIESLFTCGAVPYEKSAGEVEAQVAVERLYPVTRTDLRLSPLKRGVKGSLADRVVSLVEAASLLALEREEVARLSSSGILKTVEGTDCLSATGILCLIEDRGTLEPILADRLVTTHEAAQMLGVSKSFVYDMYEVIKKRGKGYIA